MPACLQLHHRDLVTLASQSMLADSRLVALPLNECRFPRQIAALARRGVALPPLAARLLDVLREVAPQAGRGGRSGSAS